MVNENAVVEIIKNTLTSSAWNDMMLNERKSSFVNSDGTKSYDGPTILKVLLEDIDLSSSINTKHHRQAIEQAKLQDFKGKFATCSSSLSIIIKSLLTMETHITSKYIVSILSRYYYQDSMLNLTLRFRQSKVM